MQDKMNQILLGNVTAPKQKESEAIESIEKYKALLDSGVITEEEFEAKKKQLLGL
ncbi:MAG: SHOCT domain-containing protein [Ruminococcaceae bacterium]|nr:SHOCT domain-containing protein [Oscillospiraceae bacterium]MBE6696866.1 SHOCT domain-containing protein [Oscillospiraceae bacterium]